MAEPVLDPRSKTDPQPLCFREGDRWLVFWSSGTVHVVTETHIQSVNLTDSAVFEQVSKFLMNLAEKGGPTHDKHVPLCKVCGSPVNLVKINEKPEYVCQKCWDEKGYEYDPTPWW